MIQSIKRIQHGFKNGEMSSLDLVEYCIRNIKKSRKYNIFVNDTFDLARKRAMESDARRNSGQSLGLLDGMPIAVKDSYCMQDVETTASSFMLKGFVPNYESTVTQRLWEKGAVPIGKVNMDEFAMGSATTKSMFGTTINPWSTSEDMVAGGSSGGSAAAVAAECCVAALGTDTGGSVRQPAAFCGVVGMKPTYGRVSRYGIIAYASSLDTPGILARSTEDAGIVLNAIAGVDERDSTTMRDEISNEWCMNNTLESLQGVTVGIPSEYIVEELPIAIRKEWNVGIQRLIDAGAKVVQVSLPSTQDALASYYIIACAEAASNLSRYDGVRYGHRAGDVERVEHSNADALHDLYCRSRSDGFGEEVKRRILSGNYVLSSSAIEDFYEKAVVIRHQIQREFSTVFQNNVDVLLTPTSPTEPFSIKYAQQMSNPAEIYLHDIYTVPASLAGMPAISVPVRRDGKLPLGLQMIANHGKEQQLFSISRFLESSL